MVKGRVKQFALLLLLMLATFAAAEVAGTAERRGNSVPCSADGCGDCWCCLPPAIVSLKTCQVAKTDDRADDLPATAMLSLTMFLPLSVCKLSDFTNLSLYTLTPSSAPSPRAPPVLG